MLRIIQTIITWLFVVLLIYWCTKNLQQRWFFKFQFVTPIEKKMGLPKNASQRNSNSKMGRRGESEAAKTPEGETPQDALTCGCLEAHEMGYTRSTGSVSHSSKSENSLSDK